MLILGKEEDVDTLITALLTNNRKDGSRKLAIRKLNDRSLFPEERLDHAVRSAIRVLTEKITSEPSIESAGSYFEALKTLQEDLSSGREMVSSARDLILPGVAELLKFSCGTVRIASPSVAQKIYKLMQTALHFLSHYLSPFDPPVDGIGAVLDVCMETLSLESAPLDVVNNSGIVLVQILRLRGETGEWKNVFASVEPVQQLSVLNGLLSVFDAQFLNDVVPEGGVSAVATAILDVCSRSTDNALALLAARTLESWTNIALKELSYLTSNSQFNSQFDSVFRKLLEKLWSDLDHAIDSVRLSARRAFENLVKVAVSVQGNKAIDLVLKMTLEAPVESRRRYVGLARAMTHDSQPAFTWAQTHALDLINQCQNPVHGSSVKECLTGALRWSSANLDKETFSSRWLQPLLTSYETSGSQHIYALVEQAIKDSQCDIQQLKESGNLKILLTFLLVCKKSGIAITDSDENDVLRKSLTAADHQIRLNGLRLIIASPKTVEPISNSSLALLQELLHLNFYCQSNDSRHQFIGIAKKMISRLSASSKSLFRSKVDGSASPSFTAYTSFINWLWSCCVSRVDSPIFGTRCIALQILKLLKDFFLTGSDSKINIQVTPEQVATLLVGFEDSYEENKLLTLELLTTVETSYFKDDLVMKELYRLCLDNLVSFRPPTTVAGAILLRLLLRKNCYPDSSSKVRPNLEVVFELLLGMLKEQVEVGKRNLLEAAAVGPFYGVVAAIRGILSDPLLRPGIVGSAWKHRLHETLLLAQEVCTLVMPVVASSSPEGHLPMDLETACMSNVVSVLSRNGLSTDNHGLEPFPVSSQLLLVCCWRSVKEVSLLIGGVVTDLPVNDMGEGLIGIEEALGFGQFLLDVLLDSKHRGAFEQAAVGFTMVCSAFFKSDSGLLSQQPQIWLEQVISDLESGVETSNYCATRRSAGLPFMILAIFHGEMSVSSNTLFKSTMPRLLAIVEAGRHLEAKVHAYNILRFLYRDTKLGEMVHPFMADGIRLAIIGCRASTWSERNTATLMFSALMTRVFGVNRPSDPANRSAGVTGRTFFHQHPSLYSFLLEELQVVVKSVGQDLHPSLFPILLLLSRLQPSSGALENNVLKISSFVPCIVECAASPIMKVRELAARVLPGLVGPHQVEDLLRSLCLETFSNRGMNRLHGLLLQILSLLTNMPYCACEFFTHWISMSLSLLNPFLPGDVGLAVVKILEVNFEKWKRTNLKANCDYDNLLCRLGNIVATSGNGATLPVLQAKSVNLYFEIACCLAKPDGSYSELNAAMHGSYEVRSSALENIVKHCRVTKREELLATLDTSQLFKENHPACLARWIDVIGCCGGQWDKRTVDFLRKVHSESKNEELTVSTVLALGSQVEVFKDNLDLMLKAVKSTSPASVREAVLVCLEANKGTLQEQPSEAAAWAILLHALHDDVDDVWLLAARVASWLVGSSDSIVLHPYLCIEKIVDLLRGKESHLLEFLEDSFRQEALEMNEEMDDESTVFPRSTNTQSDNYFRTVLSSWKA